MNKEGIVLDGYVFAQKKYKSLGLYRERNLSSEKQSLKMVNFVMQNAERFNFDKVFGETLN